MVTTVNAQSTFSESESTTSKSVLKDYGYDISFLDQGCSDITPIIYFDVNHVLYELYDGSPITFRTNCDINYE